MTSLTETEQKLQRHRLRMTGLSVTNFALQSGIIALYAWSGSSTWEAALAFFVVSVGTSLSFCVAIHFGWNLRLKDPGMLVAQLASSWMVQLVFIAVEPKLSLIFLVCLLVGYNYAMIGFDRKLFIAAWLVQGAATGLALVVSHGRFGFPGTTTADIGILWLFFFLCIYRLTAIGTEFNTLRAKVTLKNRQLSESLERIEQLASHDDLTGALNRRSFMRHLETERARSARAGQTFCVALLDIDHFKSVNDRFGHGVGDSVLKQFCAIAAESLRASDVFARYGGEEFIVLLAAPTRADEAEQALNRIRAAVEAGDWSTLTPGRSLTVSAGIASSIAGESVEQLISRADRALYAAKDGGRNRVVLDSLERSFTLVA
jgi:diguanylate cyclase (GGDEF)-like protein